MTKRQRLQRFADVIRSRPPGFPLYLFINLEYREAGEWKYLSQPCFAVCTRSTETTSYTPPAWESGSVGDAPKVFRTIETGISSPEFIQIEG